MNFSTDYRKVNQSINPLIHASIKHSTQPTVPNQLYFFEYSIFRCNYLKLSCAPRTAPASLAASDYSPRPAESDPRWTGRPGHSAAYTSAGSPRHHKSPGRNAPSHHKRPAKHDKNRPRSAYLNIFQSTHGSLTRHATCHRNGKQTASFA